MVKSLAANTNSKNTLETVKKQKLQTKRSLRETLQRDFNFDTIQNLIYLYKDQEKLYKKLSKRFIDRFSQGRELNEILTDAEYKAWSGSWENQIRILFRLLNFQWPRLKSMEIKSDQKPITWNLFFGDTPPHKQLINITQPQQLLEGPDDDEDVYQEKYLDEGDEEND